MALPPPLLMQRTRSAEFTALPFLLTQFPIPASSLLAHAASLYFPRRSSASSCERRRGAAETPRRNKAAAQAGTRGQGSRGKLLQVPLSSTYVVFGTVRPRLPSPQFVSGMPASPPAQELPYGARSEPWAPSAWTITAAPNREILRSLDKNYRMKCFIQLPGGVKQGEDVDFS